MDGYVLLWVCIFSPRSEIAQNEGKTKLTRHEAKSLKPMKKLNSLATKRNRSNFQLALFFRYLHEKSKFADLFLVPQRLA